MGMDEYRVNSPIREWSAACAAADFYQEDALDPAPGGQVNPADPAPLSKPARLRLKE